MTQYYIDAQFSKPTTSPEETTGRVNTDQRYINVSPVSDAITKRDKVFKNIYALADKLEEQAKQNGYDVDTALDAASKIVPDIVDPSKLACPNLAVIEDIVDYDLSIFRTPEKIIK